MNLALFTQPQVLRQVGRKLLVEFFAHFTHLLPSKYSLPNPKPDNETYFESLAWKLQRPQELPFPLAQALYDLEATAAALHRPEAIRPDDPASNRENTASDRLRQATELWLVASKQREAGYAAAEQRPAEGGPVAAKQVEPTGPVSQPLVAPKSDVGGSTINSQPSTSENTPHSDGHAAQQASPAGAQPATCNLQPSTPVPLTPHSEIRTPHSDPALPTTDSETFARLARLPLPEYDHVRRAEARRLHLRVQTLDAEVERRRSQLDDANAHGVQLPELEPWPEPVLNLAEVLDLVTARYTLHIVLPSGAADVFSLFTAHCHAPSAARQSPRLNLFSLEGGCGKTTTIEVMATMVPRPLRAENMSPAVLFRVVGQEPPPTLLLDELDTWLAKDPELRGLLNAGHKPGSHAYRCEGPGNAIRRFKAYAPAVLAGIGSLPPTLRDRSILIPLVKAQEGQPHACFDSNKTELENTLGRKLARWVKDNFAALQACDPVLPAGAFNRLADNWRPLFAIAQLAGGNWPQRAAAAFASLTVKSASQQDFVLTLIADIRRLFAQSGAQRMFSRAAVNSLRALPDRPYSRDPKFNEIRLARYLAPLGIYPKLFRIGQHRGKGYEFSDVTETPPANGATAQ